MSPFSTVNSRDYDAQGVRLFNEALQVQGNMPGTDRTGPEMKLTQAAKHFYLRKVRRYTTVVLTAFEDRTVDCIVDRQPTLMGLVDSLRSLLPPHSPLFPFSVF